MFNIEWIEIYIEKHKSEICCVLCGYTEVWLQSARVVFCNGNYTIPLHQLNFRVSEIQRTPYMEVIFNDGSIYFMNVK